MNFLINGRKPIPALLPGFFYARTLVFGKAAPGPDLLDLDALPGGLAKAFYSPDYRGIFFARNLLFLTHTNNHMRRST
jgi:hypothetical protein